MTEDIPDKSENSTTPSSNGVFRRSAEANKGKEKTPSIEELSELPLKMHDDFKPIWKEFARKKWGLEDAPSFHTSDHINAVFDANDAYMDGLDRGVDPLGLLAGLAKFNAEMGDNPITREELPEVLRFVIGWHDVGNVVRGVGDDLEPDFQEEGYKAKGAEGRSKESANKAVDASDMDSDKKKRYKAFASHAIDGTIYSPEPKEDKIKNYMEVMDQVGNDIFTVDDRRLDGLVLENVAENSDYEYDPKDFHNFARTRIAVLVPDEANRRMLLEKSWGKGLPTEVDKGDGKVKGAERVAQMVSEQVRAPAKT